MAKYTSGKQKNLKVGITSYSENRTSLEVIGKVGIGTTNATSSLYVVGDQYVSGISTLGTVKISSGIITSTTGIAATFYGDFVGTASSAGFAATAFKLEGFDFNTTTVGFATTATNVINGIASVTQLNVSGFSTVGILTATKIGIGTTNPTSELFVVGNSSISGIVTVGSGNTGIVINGTTGIITSISPGVSTVTYFGNLKGNSDTTSKLKSPVNIGGVSFDGSSNISLKGVDIAGDQNTSGTASNAANLNFGVSKGIYFRDISGTNAITSNNLTFDGNDLKVSGLTTAGSLNISGVSTFGVLGTSGGVVIRSENGAGIVTSSNPGFTTVTFYGNLVGTASVDVQNVTNTTNVIGGIASVTDLSVSGLSTVGILTATKIGIGIGTTNFASELFVVGNSSISGIVTIGTGNTGVVINGTTGIITSISPGVGIVTLFGNLSGTASTASFATTAYSLDGFDFNTTTVGSAKTATDVIGGIGSIKQLSVSGITTIGSGNTGIVISAGIITSISGFTTVTFVGNLTGTASTAGFAATAYSLDGFDFNTTTVGSAKTATDVIGGIGSIKQLSVSGITTIGSGNTGIVISAGIITSISGFTTVTFVGNLTGTASTAGFAQTAFELKGFDVSTASVGFATTATNVINGIASVTQLNVSGFSTVGVLTATKIGIGTTNPTSELVVVGNTVFGGTGIVTAVEYNGNLKFGTPSGTGFKTGAVAITTTSNTKDAVNDINFILGKLVPKPPTTIAGVILTLTSLQPLGNQTRFLCGGFTPTNNDPTTITGIASGNSYFRNNDKTISTLTLQKYGPGDSGTVTALLNFGNGVGVGVGTTTLSPLSSGSNNGTFGSLVISNDQDASITGIVSGFYEVYDVNINNASCPDGFNSICIRHIDGSNTYTTTKPFWYEDPSTVSAPVLSAGTISPPSDPIVSLSSGIPHYTESGSNAFTYVLTCQNATGDMYSNANFCSGGSQTTAFQSSGSKSYTDFGGTNPPVRDFGVGTGVTTLIIQSPQNIHAQVSSASLPSYTASTPYGSGSVSPTLSQTINIMGTTAITGSLYDSKIDENNISVSVLGSTPVGSRTSAISGVDNPVTLTPYTTSWDENLSLIGLNGNGNNAGYEATVVGGVLKHDLTNYTTFLPSGPDYSSTNVSVGRTTAGQYFQFAFTRTPVLKFGISVTCDTNAYSGCWVSQPNNAAWKSALSGTNGWANMFIQQPGTPSNVGEGDGPGCALGAVMTGSSSPITPFQCTFGTFSSSGGGGLIVVRFKLNPAKSITSIKITTPA